MSDVQELASQMPLYVPDPVEEFPSGAGYYLQVTSRKARRERKLKSA
jgi:hypothetical protein